VHIKYSFLFAITQTPDMLCVTQHQETKEINIKDLIRHLKDNCCSIFYENWFKINSMLYGEHFVSLHFDKQDSLVFEVKL